MSEGALVNTSAVRWPDSVLAGVTVRSMQIKFASLAGEDSSRRFGDLLTPTDRGPAEALPPRPCWPGCDCSPSTAPWPRPSPKPCATASCTPPPA